MVTIRPIFLLVKVFECTDEKPKIFDPNLYWFVLFLVRKYILQLFKPFFSFFFCLVLFLLKIFCLKCKRNGRIRCCKRRSSRWYGQRDEEREMIPEVRGHGGRTTEMSNVTVEAEQTYRIPRFSKLYKRQLFSLK